MTLLHAYADLTKMNHVKIVSPTKPAHVIVRSSVRDRARCQHHNSHAFRCVIGSTSGKSKDSVVMAAALPEVVLTREQGKNGEMAKRLRSRDINVLEMPLVETGSGPDRDKLVETLRTDSFDYVLVTSPESASVLIAAWKEAGQPEVNVAVVGDGTGKILAAEGSDTLRPVFVPSKANAVHFSAELPLLHDRKHRVLYPASAKASTTLQEGLAARGFEVVRLNTYTTQQVSSLDAQQLQLARKAQVLAVASPSAVKAWVHLAGGDGSPAIAAIGSTSADAARALGLSRIYSPDAPGLDGWIDSILEALAATEAAF